jgi:DNA-3-methyladenine glycosylase
MKFDEHFFRNGDVKRIARQLLGQVLITNIDAKVTSGIIVETEAYSYRERGCHAYNSRMTKRNSIMFEQGGKAYVYLCYGIHCMFNVVTNKPGFAEAVLVRAVQPLDGQDIMMERADAEKIWRIASGPGKLCKALGIDLGFNGASLLGEDIYIEQCEKLPGHKIAASPRIGIDYAGEDALLPWRFIIRGNEWISKP